MKLNHSKTHELVIESFRIIQFYDLKLLYRPVYILYYKCYVINQCKYYFYSLKPAFFTSLGKNRFFLRKNFFLIAVFVM